LRLILDTNVWTYIGERRETRAFEQLEDELGLDVVIPPSILLEALRIPVDDVLARVAEAMTERRGARTHPLPEARLEADELISQARVLRPRWFRRFPAPGSVSSLEAFWTRRLWQEAARDPKRVAARLPKEMDQADDVILAIQNANKRVFLDASFHFEGDPPLFDLRDQPTDVTLGWDGDRIEAWRFEGANVWWRGLVTEPRRARRVGGDTTYADWAGASLDLDMVGRNRPDFNRFWYYEVSADSMPRAWLRSMVHWVQLETKIGVGNPRDAQHAAYLLDADIFVTADRRFRRVLDLCGRGRPHPLPKCG